MCEACSTVYSHEYAEAELFCVRRLLVYCNLCIIIGGQGQGWGTVVCASAAVARGARRARSTRT